MDFAPISNQGEQIRNAIRENRFFEFEELCTTWKGSVSVLDEEERDTGISATSLACTVWPTKSIFIEALIEAGADKNRKDNVFGNTPLMHAARAGSLSCVKFLLSKGANVNARNKKGKTALMIACSAMQPYIVSALLESFADLEVEDNEANTAAICAIDCDDNLCLDLLIKGGLNMQRLDTNGYNMCVYATMNGNAKALQTLITSNEFVRGLALAGGGDTLIHIAALHNQVATLTVLLGVKSIDVNAKNDNGFTAIALARHFQYHECVDKLLQAGAIDEAGCVIS